MDDTVRELIAADGWRLLSSPREDPELWMLRWRPELPSPAEVDAYSHCKTILWAFAPEGSGVSLDPETLEVTHELELQLRAALEQDALAVLVAVLTGDGARQWVFYTHDADDCADRIDEVLDEYEDELPIELGAFDDPGWTYLVDELLKNVPRHVANGGDA